MPRDAASQRVGSAGEIFRKERHDLPHPRTTGVATCTTRETTEATCPRCRKLIEAGELVRLEQVAAEQKAAYEAKYGAD